jgi:hypothetical protein
MTLKKILVTFALGLGFSLLIDLNPGFAQESHVGHLTGNAGSGKQLYRR